ncbi:MAG TPA: hypothetical protein VFE56_01370, partial [Candidatus Binataceae bacterium]|nr:hypothetical protein [Candidatus Binataceae bacterium]
PGGKVKNLGGLKADGTPVIPKTAFISETEFNFAAPPTAISGPSYVQLLNPPYVPFSSTGNTPAGALTLP